MTNAGRALRDALLGLTPAACVARVRSVAWASMGMVGERHCIRMSVHGAQAVAIARNLVRELPEHRFMLSDILVADVVATIVRSNDEQAIAEVEALTLAEPSDHPRPDTRLRSPSARRSSSCALAEGPGSGLAPCSDKPDSSRAINSVTLSSSSASLTTWGAAARTG